MSCNLGFILGQYGYKSIPRTLQKSETKLLSCVFYQVDEGNKGYLNSEDLKVAFSEILGYKPSKYEVEQLLNSFGDRFEHCRGVKLAQFMAAMTEKLSKVDLDEQIRHTFMAMDFHCRGFLTVEDLRRAFSQVAPHIPAHSIDTTFRELDRDGDGRVSYKDFDFMMKYDPDSHI